MEKVSMESRCHSYKRSGNKSSTLSWKVKDGRDPSDIEDRIRALRHSLFEEEGLNSRTDDKFLLKFLRARKFDHHKAMDLIRSYYKQRTKYPELYRNLQASFYPNLLNDRRLGKLAHKNPEGSTVFYETCLRLWNPEKVPVLDKLAFSLLSFELALEDEEAQHNGFVFILDASGFGIKHLRAFDAHIIAQVISVTLNSFPAKFKKVHIVKTPYYFKILFAMIKPFLTQKLRSRIKFHDGEFKSLHKYIPPAILPQEFGGDLGPAENSEWFNRLLQNDPYIKKDSGYGYITEYI